MKKSLCILLTTAIMMLSVLTACGLPMKYKMEQDIENIVSAQIAEVTPEGETRIIEDTEVLGTLDAQAAQALAQALCRLDCESVTPPIDTIAGQTVIFYYSDGSCEMISEHSNRYITADGTSYGCRVFDDREFDALLSTALEYASAPGEAE